MLLLHLVPAAIIEGPSPLYGLVLALISYWLKKQGIAQIEKKCSGAVDTCGAKGFLQLLERLS